MKKTIAMLLMLPLLLIGCGHGEAEMGEMEGEEAAMEEMAEEPAAEEEMAEEEAAE